MLSKEKLATEKFTQAICEKIKENTNAVNFNFLIGKNDEVFVFTEEFIEKSNMTEFHQGFLYSVSTSGGQILLNKVLKCEYSYVEFFKGRPYLNIELLRVLDKSKMKTGLGTIMINYLEHLALKNNCFAVQGEFSPLRPEYREDVKHFYQRNGFLISFAGMKNFLRKEKENLREVKVEKVGFVNVFNTVLSNKLLHCEMEK
ncbi:MAG: hypothetical protein ACOX6H_02940 [Christensenellales bacterium]